MDECLACGRCDACISETRSWLCTMAVHAIANAPIGACWIGLICKAAMAADEETVADMLLHHVPTSEWTLGMRELFAAVGQVVPKATVRRPSESFADEAEAVPSGSGIWFESEVMS